MKTENEILTYIYDNAIVSPLQALSGGIYKKVRPTNSTAEDCLISLISGITGKHLQNGSLQIKIFYNQMFANNTQMEDTVRGQVLQKLLYDFSLTLLQQSTISFEEDTREIYSVEVPEIKQYFAILKMNYLL